VSVTNARDEEAIQDPEEERALSLEWLRENRTLGMALDGADCSSESYQRPICTRLRLPR